MKLFFTLLAVLSATFTLALRFWAGWYWDWSITLGIFSALSLIALLDAAFAGVNFFLPLRNLLVEEWRQAWKWLSMQMMAGAAVCQLLEQAIRQQWDLLPPAILTAVPANYVAALGGVLLLLGIVGRLVKQKSAGGAA